MCVIPKQYINNGIFRSNNKFKMAFKMEFKTFIEVPQITFFSTLFYKLL